MRLSTVLISVFILIAVIGGFFSMYISYLNSSNLLKEQVYTNLETTVQSAKTSIGVFVDSQKRKLEIAATQNELTTEELQGIVQSDNDFYELFILDANGVITASSNESHIGLNRSSDTYFTNARSKTYVKPVYHSDVTLDHAFTVSTPFHEGVLAARIRLDALDRIVSDRTGLGETGETLLAYYNDEGDIVYFTRRRFSEKRFETIPKEKALNQPVYHALLGENGLQLHPDLRDYRNVSVLAATEYIPELNVGMVTKIDVSEALGGLEQELFNISIITAIALVLFFAFVGSITAIRITKPINSITKSVDAITKGDLNIRLEKNKIDEIQALTNSLNRVLASMKLAMLKVGLSKEAISLGEAVKARGEAEKQYENLFDYSNDAIFIHDFSGKFLNVNKTAVQKLGYSHEEFMKLTPRDIDSPRFANIVSERIEELKNKGSIIFESAHVTKDGREIPVEISSIVISYKGQQAIMSVARDISQRRTAENLYKNLYESASDAIMTLEPPTWKFTSGNPATLEMFKVKSEEEFKTKDPGDVSPEYQPDGQLSSEKVRKMIEKAMQEGSSLFEWTHKKLDGEDFPANVRLTRVEIGGKKFLQATVRDLTEDKKITEGIKIANKAWKDTFDALPDLIFILDKESRIIQANKAFLNAMKLKEEDITGRRCYEIVHKTKAPWPGCPHQQTLKDKKPHSLKVDDPNIGVPLQISTTPIIDEKGELMGTVHVARIVSDK